MKPGFVSFQSLNVRTGICFLSKVPDLVVEIPCPSRLRYGLRMRSAVAGLTARSWSDFLRSGGDAHAAPVTRPMLAKRE